MDVEADRLLTKAPWMDGPVGAGFQPFPDHAMRGSVTDRFFEVAEQHADRVALTSPSGRWTYGELAVLVRRGARAVSLAANSESPVPVALIANHDGPVVIALMSVVAAGHIVVVIDPASPETHIDHVMGESGAKVLLFDEDHAEFAAGVCSRHADVASISIADLWSPSATAAVDPPKRDASDPLMLAFTSGTSGQPKAAVVNHGVILNLVRGATNRLGITCDDRMPMLFPISLAVASYPMFIPLLNGATLATLDVRGQGLAPFGEFMINERVTVAYMAPTIVRFLVDAVAGLDFPDLRLVALGGEMVDGDVVKLTAELFGPDLIANGFGTTETGVIALHLVDPDDQTLVQVPAGRPVQDVDFVLLDDAGHVVAQGDPGEIAVSSPYVFDGYWGHDELSRSVISEDPQGRPGWKLYRTGDLGVIDEKGALVVLGRTNTTVKVRGRFVVLGDVETLLHGLDAIADAAVVAVARHGVVELCAVVVPAADRRLDERLIRAELLDRVESYQVPARWRTVSELPRLPNGKVDRQAITHIATGSDARSSAVAPASGVPPLSDSERSSLERELRGLWEQLLPVEQVGLDDDFFALGGDSLLAAQMLVMAEQRLGVIVPMGDLVHARTVRSLAARMGELADSRDIAVVSCVQFGDESSRPRLWFVPDLQGSSYRVRHLAKSLGIDQAVWSFESPLLAGLPNRFTSLDTFAAFLNSHLTAAQPEGPVWLAGYSFGGICAYEMARQLRRDGREVAFLGVVDVGPGYRGPNWSERRVPFRPWFGVAKPPMHGSSFADQCQHYWKMARTSPVGAARHLMVRTGLYRGIDPFRFRLDLRKRGRVRPEWRLWYAWEEHWRLGVKSWDRSRTYAGQMDLLWASQTGSTDNSLGWGELVADLRIWRFDGFHDDLLEERGAPELGRALRSSLDAKIVERNSAVLGAGTSD